MMGALCSEAMSALSMLLSTGCSSAGLEPSTKLLSAAAVMKRTRTGCAMSSSEKMAFSVSTERSFCR